MSRMWWWGGLLSACFPRVSGDEPGLIDDPYEAFRFSPRERG